MQLWSKMMQDAILQGQKNPTLKQTKNQQPNKHVFHVSLNNIQTDIGEKEMPMQMTITVLRSNAHIWKQGAYAMVG